MTEITVDEITDLKATLSQILDELERSIDWHNTQAYPALSNLYNKWRKLCEESSSVQTELFQNSCGEILQDCVVIQQHIVDKCRDFSEKTDDLFFLSNMQNQADEDINTIAKEIVSRWNDSVLPESTRLYEQAEDLEFRIWKIRGF